LLGEIGEGQTDQRKEIIPVLTALIKAAAERTTSKTDAEVLQGIDEVDHTGTALLKCGPEAKRALAKEVVPRLKDLQFHKTDTIRQTAEELRKKIEAAQ
jgi:hypothetical protein